MDQAYLESCIALFQQHKNYKQHLIVLKCTNFVGYQHGSVSIVYLHHKSQTRNYSSIVLPKCRPTNCSSLNQHLFHKNIIDNPQCECGAVEDTQHFFLRCNRFNDLRQELVNKISLFCQPTLDVFFFFLYESSHNPIEENTQIFLAVQDFIINTKRF